MTDWNPDTLEQEARAVDGLEDFGEPAHREALEKLLYSLEHEAQLNNVGEMVLRQRVVDILATRLRVQEYLKRHPEIRDEVIAEPLVIVGLPRTGTTMLHRTIAADHRMFSPLWYETRFPCPALDWDPAGVDQRVVEGKAEMAAMLEANPDLLSVHPMDVMGPDEDIMLLDVRTSADFVGVDARAQFVEPVQLNQCQVGRRPGPGCTANLCAGERREVVVRCKARHGGHPFMRTGWLRRRCRAREREKAVVVHFREPITR